MRSFGVTYIEACLEVADGGISKIAGNLDSSLSSFIRGERTFEKAGEAVMVLVFGGSTTTKGNLIKKLC